MNASLLSSHLIMPSALAMQAVNSVVRVYDAASGQPKTAPIDSNAFYGLPAALDTQSGRRGPFITDPTCVYDADTRRFFLVTLVIAVDPASGDFLGSNSMQIAVSKTSDPTGAWNIYRIPVQNDGSNGTPNHNAGGATSGDYPQCGHDAYGFFITTNEFGDVQTGSNIYVMSKRALAAGADQVVVSDYFLDQRKITATNHDGDLGYFTIMPMRLPANPTSELGGGLKDGVAYFTSTPINPNVDAILKKYTDILFWSLSGTKTLDSPTPQLNLQVTRHFVGPYFSPIFDVVPARQKDGLIPLGNVANLLESDFGISNLSDVLIPGVQPLDGGDARMQWLTYAAGTLWSVFMTTGVDSATSTPFDQINIKVVQISPEGRKVRSLGTLSLPPRNSTARTYLLYPALAMSPSGKGAISFTLTGTDFYPSATFATVDDHGLGPGTVSYEGQAPQDGFIEYQGFNTAAWRPRWGDYSAAAVDEKGILYLAAEVIPVPNCDPGTFISSETFRCNRTRAFFANWGTAITKLAVKSVDS